MNSVKMTGAIRSLLAEGKGLLAMDESNSTCNRRFEKIGIPQTEEYRRAYRELILTTPGLGEFISGAKCNGYARRGLYKPEMEKEIEPAGTQRT
jgi:fructose-bisphosphate aldolase class I